MPKADLVFAKPLMNAAGMLGFAPDPRAPIAWDDLGAFVTHPISLRPRSPAEHPAVVEYPGGFLLHTGLPNPGLRTALERNRRRWQESRTPIIVHLMADRPEETREMVRLLEGVDGVMAIELGFAPLLADDIILLAVDMAAGELPLIACLPQSQLLRLGHRCLDSGATAISMAPPRGTLEQHGRLVAGRLFGAALYPMALEVVQAAGRLGLPIIAAGGVFSAGDARAMLAAGAVAVQQDALLWLPTGNKRAPS